MDIAARIASELKIRPSQAEGAIKLLDEGNTVPFIARYRKEATGSLDDAALRELEEKLAAYRAVDARRDEVKRLIGEQGMLTDELTAALDGAATVTEIDDIYRPYRPKRRTRASAAVEAGLGPLAELMLAQDASADIAAAAEGFVSEEKGIADADAALRGAMDIIAEKISDDASIRKWVREYIMKNGTLECRTKTDAPSAYDMYADYSEPVRRIPPHRILAADRGEREGVLSVKIEADAAYVCTYIKSRIIKGESSCRAFLESAAEDSYSRLIAPSVKNEIRGALTDTARERSLRVFGENLKNLLMQPPIRGKVVMGFDPAYRTGCKIAVVNDIGELLDTAAVYPTPPQNDTEKAKKVLTALINRHKVDIISIGNGTASKESEIFVAGLIKELERPVAYVMTNEAGASVYSASKLGTEEFGQLDVSLRSAVSIARRIQDPLAELVKIDPKSIGVGQYQHDMDPKRLGESLSGVVESCVSAVGADLNTASVSLLSHIAGINAKTAKSICEYRTAAGRFSSRSELKKVKGIGEKAYTQCVGFLRVPESAEPLDNTAVHPEAYGAAAKLLEHTGYTAGDIKARRLSGLADKVDAEGRESVARLIGVGVPTLEDIINELQKPGRDPRDGLPAPVLRTDAMDIGSLRAGMEFDGTVRNVADFGAFVDIGVHQDGLVHISKLAKGFVRNAADAVSVGDVIKVRVLDVDMTRKRISLERVFEK